MRYYDKELQKLAMEMRRTRRDLRELPRRLEQREIATRQDENLTAEAKKIRLRQVREEEHAKQQKLHGRLLDISEEAQQLERKIRVQRSVDETARARVRDLLDRGLAHRQILEQAVSLGDDDAVEALRWEAMYHGTKDGFADARDTIEACDRALAKIGRGGQQDSNRAIVSFREAAAGIHEVDKFAAKVVDGTATPFDRLSFGHAVAGEDDDA